MLAILVIRGLKMIVLGKSPVKHLIEGAEFWLERVKTCEEMLNGELSLATSREEIVGDLARYAKRLHEVAGKLDQVVNNE